MPTRPSKSAPPSTTIRVGIGGWSYEPWRETFYPADVPKKRELQLASTQSAPSRSTRPTTARSRRPASRAGATRRRTTSSSPSRPRASRPIARCSRTRANSIDFFVGSGIEELGGKLGALLWQFMPTKRYDEDDFARFVERLPTKLGSLTLRHALDVRHESFRCESFVALARQHGVAIVCSDSDDHPMIADVTADFVYARLMRAKADVPTGYDAKGLATWTAHARDWSAGKTIEALGPVVEAAPTTPRDVFVFFINGAKERAPAGAMAMRAALEAD